MRKLCLILAAMLYVMLLPVKVCATEPTHGFDTNELTAEEQQTILTNMEMELLHEEGTRWSIACFDVHPDGRIALGFEDSNKKYVYVYDETGTYLYGYKFNCTGSFGVVWHYDDLAIYITRGKCIGVFDKSGQCVDFEDIRLTDTSVRLEGEILYKTHISMNGKEYNLARDLGIRQRNYSRLVVKDAVGTERVLYDVSQDHNSRVIANFILLGTFLIILGYALYKQYKIRKADTGSEERVI